MATVSAVVVLLCACLASGFHPHPLPLPFPLPPHVNPIVERPQKHFSGSVCPPDSTCVRQQDCSRQCRPGWDSFGLGSCYWVAPAVAATQSIAHSTCVGLGGHLPVVESAEELPRLLEFGAQWTNATWDGDSATWVWDATGRPVDFSALGTAPAPAGSAATPCLVMVPGPPPRFEPRDCKQTALYLCETGSSSVSRCAGQSERICCAVAADHYGEPCYVDEQGTRCEQRIREGYFPLGESLVRPTEGADGEQLSWAQARQQCRADGGDLLTVDDSQMDKSIIAILSALAPLGATEFYIGLSSDALGQFSYVNGTRAEAGDAFLNFATATDASRPSSCVFYSGAAWSSGDCSTPRDFICHIRRVRHSLRQEPEVPRCGVRQTQGVLGKSGARFHHPPLLPPPLLPPLGPADDGRRGAAQFGEFTWQAAIWTRSGSAGHEFSCSGALIHPAWVLTSARCVSDAAPADLKVTVGDWNLDESQPVNLPPVALDVTRVRVSPGRVSHGPYGPVLESGRLALLQVTPELDGGEYPHVGPICLPDTSLLQQIHQFRCVVTGWRGGSQPVLQPWGPQPKPDRRDILRKFETGVHHGPECQDEAQHLKRLRQRPQYPPHYPHPYPPIYPPPYPVPYSAAGERDWLEPRSQFSFRPPFLGHPPQQHPGPGASDQPEHYICPRDGRCIPDPGALLACALPPPPSPHQHQHVPLPPHLPHPPPHLSPFYRSAAQQNDTADPSAAPAASPSAGASGGASEPTSPVDAYEQIAKGFRPPVEKATEKRARRSPDAGGSGGPSSPLAAASAGGAGAGASAAAAPVAAAATGSSAAASAAPFASPRVVVGSADTTDAAASSGAAKPPAGGASGAGAGESAGRSAFVLPHSIIGAFHAAPPPFAPGPHAGHVGDGADPRPSVTGTRHYDAYVLVGVASAVADGCAHGHMIFDDVIQESEFIQQVLHRGG